jgi:hypothetical protein
MTPAAFIRGLALFAGKQKKRPVRLRLSAAAWGELREAMGVDELEIRGIKIAIGPDGSDPLWSAEEESPDGSR